METNEQKQSTKAINNNTYIMFINMRKKRRKAEKQPKMKERKQQ